MRKSMAAFCIAALLSHAAPAFARSASPRLPADTPITSISNPCDLTPVFMQVHAAIARMGTVTLDSGDIALKLHSTSKSRPYKQVEDDWEELLSLADPTLEKLSDLPIALDQTRDGPKKRAALALTTSYQKMIEHFVDYGHYAVDYERSQNMISQNYVPQKYSPGVREDRTRSNNDNSIRRAFDTYVTEAHDAMLSSHLPEHRYAKSCHVTSPPLGSPLQAPTDPCTLAHTFLAMHETVRRIGSEAREVGESALQLRATSRSRPYKKIEQEWLDVVSSSEPASEELTDLELTLDDAPEKTKMEAAKKKAAENLATAYREALNHFVDVAHVGVGYERTESSLSMNRQRQYLTFGVAKQAPKAAGSNISRQQFNVKSTEARDTFYGIFIPERRYQKTCGTPL